LLIYIDEIEGVWFAAAISEGRVQASSFSHSSDRDALRRVMRSLPSKPQGVVRSHDSHGLLRALHGIYSARPVSIKLQLDLSWLSPLFQKIYQVVCKIPRGYVATYKGVAKAAGSTTYARAVGYAMASNPMPLLIPCHRVVRSDLSPGHYEMGDALKRQLLLREGVKLRGQRISSASVCRL